MNTVPAGVVETTNLSDLTAADLQSLLVATRDLSYQRDVTGVMTIVKKAARALIGSDGVTFVLREGDKVFYADEDAISPLWKGQRFPASACISGWAITHKQSVVIEDIYSDGRIPHDAYRLTFVKSLAMVPIREEDPIGAIGAYWQHHHLATQREVSLLKMLAGTTAVALTNAQLFSDAKRAVEIRDIFLSVASHELKTPLTALGLQVEILRRHLQAANDGQLNRDLLAAAISRTTRQTARLDELVGALLDVSRIDLGKLELVFEQCALSDIVRDVIERTAFQLQAAKCRVAVELDNDVKGYWDRSRIEQVVFNLISNVVKYAADGPAAISVKRVQDNAVLSVQDSGPGISTDLHTKIFERFERTNAKQGTSGLGLGLFIVKTIVEAHRGEVVLDSEVGAGAKFTVILPIVDSRSWV